MKNRLARPARRLLRASASRSAVLVALAVASGLAAPPAGAQEVRPHQRHRATPGVYRPPLLDPSDVDAQTDAPAGSVRAAQGSVSAAQGSPRVVRVAGRTLTAMPQDKEREVMGGTGSARPSARTAPRPAPPVVPVPMNDVIYEDQPYHAGVYHDESWGGHVDYGHGAGCDAGCCDGWGGPTCDSGGGFLAGSACDGAGCSGCETCVRVGLLQVPRLQDCWFASAEYLYWTRRGQDFPALAVNSTANPDVVLYGGEQGEDGESGARFTLGRWLDRCQTQAIELRGWGLAEESFGFRIEGPQSFNVGRPFLTSTGTLNLLTVIESASPNASEFLDIDFESRVFGADVLAHQVLARGLGGRIDLVYGYQYFGTSEELTIRSHSVSAPTSVPPNAQLTVTDLFDIENEFHAGVFGLATHYDEGCWSFDGMVKLGLGGITRRASLSGETISQIGDPPASISDEGLLVTDSNSGSSSDGTFAVSPEVNLSLGYWLNPRTNLTFGYTYVMVTDALQVWRTIDTTVAEAIDRPARRFSYGDYWAEGVHLGLNFNY